MCDGYHSDLKKEICSVFEVLSYRTRIPSELSAQFNDRREDAVGIRERWFVRNRGVSRDARCD